MHHSTYAQVTCCNFLWPHAVLISIPGLRQAGTALYRRGSVARLHLRHSPVLSTPPAGISEAYFWRRQLLSDTSSSFSSRTSRGSADNSPPWPRSRTACSSGSATVRATPPSDCRVRQRPAGRSGGDRDPAGRQEGAADQHRFQQLQVCQRNREQLRRHPLKPGNTSRSLPTATATATT